MENNESKVYTHEIASNIVNLFDELCLENKVIIPSPEDDERNEDDRYGLYGTTYSNLLDNIEEELIENMNKVKEGALIVPYVFCNK